MVNQALIEVVKNQLAGGVSEQEVREFLRRRGTGESEIEELFSILSSDAPTLREIPVVEQAIEPVVPVVDEPVPPVVAPVTTVAHGIEREVPPLAPSAPFAPLSASQDLPIASAAVTGIVLPPAANQKRRAVIIGALIGCAALLITGGMYVYSAYFASPEKVMDTMISNVRDIQSFAFSTELTATTNNTGTSVQEPLAPTNPFASMFATQDGPTTISLKASGVFDALDEGNPKLAIALEATMDPWPMGDFIFGVDYRNLDRKNYIKVNNVPDLGFLSLSFLKDKWFVIEDKEAKSQLGASTGSSDAVIPTVTEDQRNQLRDAWREHRFLIVSEKMASEDIDGVSTHHYKLTLDKEAFVAWVIKTDAIMQQEPTDQDELNKSLDGLTIRTMEIWIGKRDAMPHKFLVEASLQDAVDPGKKADVTLVINGNDFNDPQTVTAPDGAQSFEEVLQGVFAQMLGASAPTSAAATPQERNKQRTTDIAAIANAIKKNIADNGGTFACGAGPLPQKATFLGAAGFGATGYAIEPCLVPKYLQVMPKDPTKGVLGMSGYSAYYDPNTKKITVRAPYAESGVKISTTK